jgi:hypothetical protein
VKAPSFVILVCADCQQKNRVLDPVPLGKVAQCGKCKSRDLVDPDDDDDMDDDDMDDDDMDDDDEDDDGGI